MNASLGKSPVLFEMHCALVVPETSYLLMSDD